MRKWRYVLLPLVFAITTLQVQAQTVKRSSFSVQLNEHTVVLDSAGNRLPYNVLLQKLSGGAYTLDPIKNATGNNTGEYRLRSKQAGDNGKRETQVVQQPAAATSGPKVGDTFPAFSGLDADSVMLSASELKGKVLVINFWFTQCKPCIAEMPELNSLVDSFSSNKEVVFLAPGYEKRAVIKHFLQTYALKYRVVPEASELVRNCNVSAYPTHLIIGRNGKVLKVYSGGLTGVKNFLKRDIEEALRQ